eukprot:875259_1
MSSAQSLYDKYVVQYGIPSKPNQLTAFAKSNGNKMNYITAKKILFDNQNVSKMAQKTQTKPKAHASKVEDSPSTEEQKVEEPRVEEQKVEEPRVEDSASAEKPLPFGIPEAYYYTILNVNSQLVMESPNESGHQLTQEKRTQNSNQLFKIKQLSDGVYIIQNKQTKFYVTIKADSKEEYAEVFQLVLDGDNGTVGQQFRFVADGTGNYYIFNINSGKVIQVPDGSKSEGKKLDQYHCISQSMMQWTLIPDLNQ